MAIFKTLSAAAILAVGTTAIASAAVVDLTDTSTYTLSGATGSGASTDGTINFTLAASGGNLTNFELLDAAAVGADITPLLGTVDGVGITDDEVSAGQSVTLGFDKRVEISALYFLDLFIGRGLGADHEGVIVTSNSGQSQQLDAQVTIANSGPDSIGFGNFQGLTLTGTNFTFTPIAGNDAIGVADFALAGLEAAIVPLPAGVLLLAGALGGLGFAGRRKKAQKAA
jgi:hypothetical protein